MQQLIKTYYVENENRQSITEEADKVAVNVAKILSEKSLVFSSSQYMDIHRELFYNVFPHAGKFRNCNISKKNGFLMAIQFYMVVHHCLKKRLSRILRLRNHLIINSGARELIDKIKSIRKSKSLSQIELAKMSFSSINNWKNRKLYYESIN